ERLARLREIGETMGRNLLPADHVLGEGRTGERQGGRKGRSRYDRFHVKCPFQSGPTGLLKRTKRRRSGCAAKWSIWRLYCARFGQPLLTLSRAACRIGSV